jgi:hypothetical protein
MISIYILRIHRTKNFYKILQSSDTIPQILQKEKNTDIVYYREISNPILLTKQFYKEEINQLIDRISNLVKRVDKIHFVQNGILQKEFQKNSQSYFIAQIFETFPKKWISSIMINTTYSLLWMQHKFQINDDITLKEMIVKSIDCNISFPGDVQRTLRLFFENFGIYNGITQRKHKNGGVIYMYTPPLEIKKISKQRNFSKIVINKALVLCNNKCEVCNKVGTTENPLYADHWRSHSEYHAISKDVSTIKNCVMLCLRCNNIKSNHPSITLVKKRCCSLETWQKIESRIKIQPNERETQENNKFIMNYNKCL